MLRTVSNAAVPDRAVVIREDALLVFTNQKIPRFALTASAGVGCAPFPTYVSTAASTNTSNKIAASPVPKDASHALRKIALPVSLDTWSPVMARACSPQLTIVYSTTVVCYALSANTVTISPGI